MGRVHYYYLCMNTNKTVHTARRPALRAYAGPLRARDASFGESVRGNPATEVQVPITTQERGSSTSALEVEQDAGQASGNVFGSARESRGLRWSSRCARCEPGVQLAGRR